MSNTALGHTPARTSVTLIDGQDFVHEFSTVAPLPNGTVVTLQFLNADRSFTYGFWPVVNLAVRIDAADHAGIPNGSWCRLWAAYPDDGGRFCWLAGPVGRNKR